VGTHPYVAWKKSPAFRKEREKDGAPPAITRRSMSDNKYYVN